MLSRWRPSDSRGSLKTTVFLVRHGRTDWNVTGRYHGQADIPLNAEGRRQSAALAALAAGLRPDAVWSSPLSRARATADAIADTAGLKVNTDERLAEVDVGSWTGLTAAQVIAADPGYARARRLGEDRRFSAAGETPGECAERVAAAISDLAAAHRGGRIIAVGHSYSLLMGVGRLLGLNVPATHHVAGLYNCAWGELLTNDDAWRLEAWNVCHEEIPSQRSGETITV